MKGHIKEEDVCNMSGGELTNYLPCYHCAIQEVRGHPWENRFKESTKFFINNNTATK